MLIFRAPDMMGLQVRTWNMGYTTPLQMGMKTGMALAEMSAFLLFLINCREYL